MLGVELDIDRGWHLYWPGYNETGGPPQIKWTSPEGFEVGPVQWPAPHRYISPGDILDHVYEDQVVLLVPVKVPADAGAESRASFSADLTWVICSDVCVFGGGKASITLPVASPGSRPTKTRDAKLFERFRKRLPRPLDSGASEVEIAWDGPTMTLTWEGARSLAFYPDDQCIAPADPIEDGEASGSRISLRFDPEAPGGERVSGVLEVRRASGAPEFYRLDQAFGGT